MNATPDLIDADEAEGFDAPDVTPLPLGFVVGGRYQIKKVLGMGGNGAVYEGEHTSVGHRVAIKVVHARLAEREDVIARFQREARICGTLRHPHVGQVYDVGTLDDGAPYMVMELQEGRSLADIIDDGKVPLAAVVEMVRQILSGLGAAHRAGTIHRDIKPDNVMIVRDHSGEAVAKLVDFGISKSVASKGASHRVTGEGMILGSPDYMSPEQLCSDPVDLRTDIYSMGVLLYEVITGRLPFDHERLQDLFAAILRDPVVPPSQLRRDCPPQLDAVVAKAMHRDPARRYQTTDDMSRALAEVRQVMKASPRPMAPLSEPPPRPSGVVRATTRRRTIDRRTFDDLTSDVTTQVRKRPVDQKPLIAAIAGASLLAVALAIVLGSGDDEQIVATVAPPLPVRAAAETEPAAGELTQPPAAPQPSPVSPAAAGSLQPTSTPSVEVQTPRPTAEPIPERVATGSKPRTRPAPPRPSTTREPTRDESAVNTPDVTELARQASSAFMGGRTAQARSLYQQIVNVAPRNADAWRGLGQTSSKLGERSEAARAFQRYLLLRPNAPDAARIREQLAKMQGAAP